MGERMKAIAPLLLAAVLVLCGSANAQEALNNDVSANDGLMGVADSLAEFADMLGVEQDTPRSSPKSWSCLLYTSPSPRDGLLSRMPSSA